MENMNELLNMANTFTADAKIEFLAIISELNDGNITEQKAVGLIEELFNRSMLMVN